MDNLRPVFTDQQLHSGQPTHVFQFITAKAKTLESCGMSYVLNVQGLLLTQEGKKPYHSPLPTVDHPDMPEISAENGGLVVMLFLLASRHGHLFVIDQRGNRIIPSVASLDPWRGDLSHQKLKHAAITCGFIITLSNELDF